MLTVKDGQTHGQLDGQTNKQLRESDTLQGGKKKCWHLNSLIRAPNRNALYDLIR